MCVYILHSIWVKTQWEHFNSSRSGSAFVFHPKTTVFPILVARKATSDRKSPLQSTKVLKCINKLVSEELLKRRSASFSQLGLDRIHQVVVNRRAPFERCDSYYDNSFFRD